MQGIKVLYNSWAVQIQVKNHPKGEAIMKKRIYMILFVIYMMLLILFVVLKFDGSFEGIISLRRSIKESGISNVNLVLFSSIFPYLRNIGEPYAFRNIAGNIAAFIPLGFFVFDKFYNRFFKTIITCVIIILMIECAQLVFKIGIFDVDDILLNTLGCLLGILAKKSGN